MSEVFAGKKPKANVEQQKSQRRQNQAIEKQTSDEAREAGSRRRILNRNRSGSSLFARTGASGVAKETLGG